MTEHFGKIVRLARESRGLTQEEAANSIKKIYNVRMSPAYLSMIERGERTNLTRNVQEALIDYFEIKLKPIPREAKRLQHIPLLGIVPAGRPNEVREEVLSCILVPEELDCDFALKVKGDSMTGAGLFEGDIVLCKKAYTANHGEMVTALTDNYDTTIKYLIKENGIVKLRAANPKYSDIILYSEDAIQGIVVLVQKPPLPYSKIAKASCNNMPSLFKMSWMNVIKAAEKYDVSPEKAERLIRSFGKLMLEKDDDEEDE